MDLPAQLTCKFEQNSETLPGESDTQLADSISDPEACKNGDNDTEE